jgi:hypothetical protein
LLSSVIAVRFQFPHTVAEFAHQARRFAVFGKRVQLITIQRWVDDGADRFRPQLRRDHVVQRQRVDGRAN